LTESTRSATPNLRRKAEIGQEKYTHYTGIRKRNKTPKNGRKKKDKTPTEKM